MAEKKLKKSLVGWFAGAVAFAVFPVLAQAGSEKDTVILYTNDVHCAMDDYSGLAAYGAQLEADGHEVLIVDAGDGRIKTFSGEEEVIYNLKVAGVQVNNVNAADILGDGTAVYNPETNTLILNGADLFVEKGNYGIRAEGSLNIELNGTNKIHCEDYYGIAIVASSDRSAVDVKISGNGSLESYGSDGGILVRGSLTIGDNAKVTSECGNITAGNTYGIRVNEDFTICDNAIVTANSGDAPEYSYAIYSGDNLTVSGNAKVTAEAGNGVGRSCGTYVISNIYMKDNAHLDTKGADTSESGDFASESYGIRTTNMYVSGGILDATGQGASGISAGIYTQNIEISDGTVTANSVDAKEGQSVGIQSTTALYVSGGTLNANSSDTTADSWAIDASAEMKITGGEINAITGTGDRSYGICSDTISISGGTVMVEAKDAENQSRGIQSMNAFMISGGCVNVKSGNANSQSYGLQTSAALDITGGTVIVSNGTAKKSNAIYSGNTINITDATVEVTSQGNGIYAPYGTIDIGCTEVKPAENALGLVGTKVVVIALGKGIHAEVEFVIDESLVITYPEECKTVIEPLGYKVTIKGLDYDRNVIVPAGKSVNETYPDFSETLDTTKKEYEFKGFYADETCSEGNEYSFDTVVTSDITVYAKWEENKVFPDDPHGTVGPDDSNVTNKEDSNNKSDASGAVKTGDSAMTIFWIMLAVISIATILVVGNFRGEEHHG